MRRLISGSVVVSVMIACAVALMLILFKQSSIAQANSANSDYGAPRFHQRSSDIRFTSVLTHYVYLPIIHTPLPVIAGRVTQHGAPLNGAGVTLQSFRPGFMYPQVITRTVTDDNGNYFFFNIPSSTIIGMEEEKYRAVIYGELTWFTPAITYTAGTNYTFAPVDTTGIALIAPPAGSTISLPHTFTWTARPDFPTDSYEVRLFWAPFSFGAGQVGYTTSAIVPLSVLQGNQLPYTDWYVRIYSPAGIGESYKRRVYFSWSNAHGPASGEVR
jgi:hypothetical protein